LNKNNKPVRLFLTGFDCLAKTTGCAGGSKKALAMDIK